MSLRYASRAIFRPSYVKIVITELTSNNVKIDHSYRKQMQALGVINPPPPKALSGIQSCLMQNLLKLQMQPSVLQDLMTEANVQARQIRLQQVFKRMSNDTSAFLSKISGPITPATADLINYIRSHYVLPDCIQASGVESERD